MKDLAVTSCQSIFVWPTVKNGCQLKYEMHSPYQLALGTFQSCFIDFCGHWTTI